MAPGIDRRRFNETVRTLETAGTINPIRRGTGKAMTFSDADADAVRAVLGLSGHPAVHVSGKPSDRPDTPSEPSGHLVAEVAALKARVEAAEQGRAVAAEQAGRAARQAEETARHAAELDRRAAELTAQVRDLDEERRKARFRISKLESERIAPVGIMDRFKAAWRIIRGKAAAVPALPPPRHREKGETFEQKAA